MTEDLENKWEEYYGMLKSSHAIEIRISNVAKAAELADHFVASNVTGFCNSSQESAFVKILNKVEKSCAAMVVIVGTDPENSTEDWVSFIRYCAKQMPTTTAVVAVHARDFVSGKRSFHHVQGFDYDSIQEHGSEEMFSSLTTEISDDDSFDSSLISRVESFSSSSSFFTKDLTQDIEDREVCGRSTSTGKSRFSWFFYNIDHPPVKGFIGCSKDDNNPESLILKTNLAGYRVFTYDELKMATSQFSNDNLIGEGGCSSVYKGFVGGKGKTVAIKVSKSYKEAWNDFLLEIEIVSSLKHKHITSLIGVCCEDNHIISVYDFLSKGSLQEHLHGNRNKSVLPWDARFKVAVAVAEALNYLHNECSVPVIHRDVKSSNILLNHKLHAQISDFGLAIWGPTNSSYLLRTDVVGTFGYMDPEYFMHGNVSDKIDVYSYGVLLLELLSGKSAVGHSTRKNQENLVKWAKTLIDCQMFNALMDPKLNGKFDISQMQRMVLAVTLCISQSVRLRPTMIQILRLLEGKISADEWAKQTSGDETYPEFRSDPHLNLALLELDDYTTPVGSRKPLYRFKLKDYLREAQD